MALRLPDERVSQFLRESFDFGGFAIWVACECVTKLCVRMLQGIASLLNVDCCCVCEQRGVKP